MKLYTPDKQLLIEVQSLSEHPDGLLIEGRIMGALPLKAILRPEELRAASRLARWRVVRRIVAMLLHRRRGKSR